MNQINEVSAHPLTPGTRKSRTKLLREGSPPPGWREPADYVHESVLTGQYDGDFRVLIAYIDKLTPLTNKPGWGYTDPMHPDNQRVVLTVHRLNGTMRHPLNPRELTKKLGFRLRNDYKRCLREAMASAPK